MEIAKSHKTAVLLGATGLVGGNCLDQLLEHPAYSRVRVLTRRKLPRRHERLEQHIVRFDRLEDHASLFRCHDLFLCLGTTRARAGSAEAFREIDFGFNYEAARLAAAAGANQVLLVSSMGANAESSFLYPRVKGELENAVRELDFWAIRIFRPSFLLGKRPESRWGESLAIGIMRGVDRLTGGWLSRFRPVEAEFVATAMLQTAQSLQGGYELYHSDDISRIGEEKTKSLR